MAAATKDSESATTQNVIWHLTYHIVGSCLRLCMKRCLRCPDGWSEWPDGAQRIADINMTVSADVIPDAFNAIPRRQPYWPPSQGEKFCCIYPLMLVNHIIYLIYSLVPANGVDVRIRSTSLFTFHKPMIRFPLGGNLQLCIIIIIITIIIFLALRSILWDTFFI